MEKIRLAIAETFCTQAHNILCFNTPEDSVKSLCQMYQIMFPKKGYEMIDATQMSNFEMMKRICTVYEENAINAKNGLTTASGIVIYNLKAVSLSFQDTLRFAANNIRFALFFVNEPEHLQPHLVDRFVKFNYA